MKLPINLKPKFQYNLIRIGSRHDGGYLIEKKSLLESKFLFSFGISTNWDFEKDFLKINNINFLAFDGSINDDFWNLEKKKVLTKLKKLSVSRFINFYILKWSFNKFFNKKNFISKFISTKLSNSMTFNEAISLNSEKKLFFKIDIEGSEYEFLNDIIYHQDKIIGMAIEFHECQKFINNIIKFVNDFTLEIVHIHANNYDHNINNEIPKTLELTFAKNPKAIGNFKSLPHILDSPNRAKSPEINLTFDE